jgi:hypothetical protein
MGELNLISDFLQEIVMAQDIRDDRSDGAIDCLAERNAKEIFKSRMRVERTAFGGGPSGRP